MEVVSEAEVVSEEAVSSELSEEDAEASGVVVFSDLISRIEEPPSAGGVQALMMDAAAAIAAAVVAKPTIAEVRFKP